jgi:hypothetical protein
VFAPLFSFSLALNQLAYRLKQLNKPWAAFFPCLFLLLDVVADSLLVCDLAGEHLQEIPQ